MLTFLPRLSDRQLKCFGTFDRNWKGSLSLINQFNRFLWFSTTTWCRLIWGKCGIRIECTHTWLGINLIFILNFLLIKLDSILFSIFIGVVKKNRLLTIDSKLICRVFIFLLHHFDSHLRLNLFSFRVLFKNECNPYLRPASD